MTHNSHISPTEMTDLIAKSVAQAKTRRQLGANSDVIIPSLSNEEAALITGGNDPIVCTATTSGALPKEPDPFPGSKPKIIDF